jgi:hypothetical protein
MDNDDRIYIDGLLYSQLLTSNCILILRNKKNKFKKDNDKNEEKSEENDDNNSEITLDNETMENNYKTPSPTRNSPSSTHNSPSSTHNSPSSTHNSSSHNSQLQTQNSPSPSTLPSTSPLLTTIKLCIFCYSVGHWARECTYIEDSYRSRCYRCWGLGHYANDCFMNVMEKPPWMSSGEYEDFKNFIRERKAEN